DLPGAIGLRRRQRDPQATLLCLKLEGGAFLFMNRVDYQLATVELDRRKVVRLYDEPDRYAAFKRPILNVGFYRNAVMKNIDWAGAIFRYGAGCRGPTKQKRQEGEPSSHVS